MTKKIKNWKHWLCKYLISTKYDILWKITLVSHCQLAFYVVELKLGNLSGKSLAMIGSLPRNRKKSYSACRIFYFAKKQDSKFMSLGWSINWNFKLYRRRLNLLDNIDIEIDVKSSAVSPLLLQGKTSWNYALYDNICIIQHSADIKI